MKPRIPLLATGACLGLALLLPGCATYEADSAGYWPRTGDALVDGRTAIERAPAKDKVLWQCRTAAVAMRRGQLQEARTLLDEALLSIGSLPSNDKGAKQSRSLFKQESRKSFRGEPYERIMAYYYRGILYWMDGEPDNARACFRNAQLQDSDTESKEYASDYVLLDYLDGLVTAKLGGDGSDALKRAIKESRISKPPPYDPKANVLVFAEYGNGPTKYATGEYAEQLRFRPGASTTRSMILRVAGNAYRLDPLDDLNFQATTRGGRVMDHILGNKAVFKTTTDIVGTGAIIGGAVLATQRNTREAGLGLLAAGVITKIVSAATTPEADIRCWDNLPQFLTFAALKLPAGDYAATVEFASDPNSPTGVSAKPVTIHVADPSRDTVIFVSDKSQ